MSGDRVAALEASLLKQGFALVISGPAVSGKSTLARLLADQLQGSVYICPAAAANYKPRARVVIIEEFGGTLEDLNRLGNAAQENPDTCYIAVHTDMGSYIRLSHVPRGER